MNVLVRLLWKRGWRASSKQQPGALPVKMRKGRSEAVVACVGFALGTEGGVFRQLCEMVVPKWDGAAV